MTTPMMQQYHAAKREHPDGILFFRMGDFYEMFLDDAERCAELLGLTLTSRSKGDGAIPMAGVPVRSVDTYINRLLKQGHKVVVCDQVQDPSEAKGIVERAVTRVATPGTIVEESGLAEKDHNFLLAAAFAKDRVGLAWADVSTGSFQVTEVAAAELADEVLRIDPAELLLPESALDAGSPYAGLLRVAAAARTTLPEWRFDADHAERALKEHFRVATLAGFGVQGLRPALGAAGAVLHYLQHTHKGALRHLLKLSPVRRGDRLVLDRATRASLELVRTQRDGERRGSLLAVLDRTATPMGARLLKGWVLEPLAEPSAIARRQDGVQELKEDDALRAALRRELRLVQDVERLLARVACGRASARELVGLRQSLSVLPAVRELLARAWSEVLKELPASLPEVGDLVDLLRRALKDEVPPTVREGGLIREGFDRELDELRSLGSESRGWIASFQEREQARTGIPSLKVGFNRVFGYYIEITNANAARVPADYHRKQTLKNAERYITPELKGYEEKVLGAEERINEIEYAHFLKIRDAVEARLADVQRVSEGLALADVLAGLAETAVEGRWVRPAVDGTRDLEIREGRHPVIERNPGSEPFVPNDVALKGGERELMVITGPNMAGKSTYIRQTALIALMAQVGSFVPAESARVGVVDRIFTRIGSSDDLVHGNSTFMVEMIETAEILNNASDRSLVILDEVGRGTSTFDGLSIAWAITEYLAARLRARTLFATHYHQLLDLAERLPNAFNTNVAVREWGEGIVFLHKIVEGGCDRSYGIHVARLAGIPAEVLRRAEQVLAEVEAEPVHGVLVGSAAREEQLDLFPEPEDPIRKLLKETDPDRTTPLDALVLLRRLRDLAG